MFFSIEDFENFIEQNGKICFKELEQFLSVNDVNVQSKTNGKSLLHLAANLGNITIIHYLVSKGANLNLQDKFGWTPLHYAVDFDFVVATQDGEMPTSLPTAQVLIKLGANQKIEDKNGLTPKQIISEHERMAELYDSLM